eukprot:m.349183 g.349183  ORF g.349183 m.349183 type:complete len:73 (+) comp27948_c0_seq1:3415-3633(+)
MANRLTTALGWNNLAVNTYGQGKVDQRHDPTHRVKKAADHQPSRGRQRDIKEGKKKEEKKSTDPTGSSSVGL